MATRVNKLLWWVICVSSILFIYVSYAIGHFDTDQHAVDRLFPALLLLSLVIAAGTTYWRKRALVDPIQSGQVDLNSPEALEKLLTPFLLNLVLSQAVTIFGFLLFWLSNEPLYTVGFVAGSLTLMYVHRPTAAELQAPRSSGSAGTMETEMTARGITVPERPIPDVDPEDVEGRRPAAGWFERFGAANFLRRPAAVWLEIVGTILIWSGLLFSFFPSLSGFPWFPLAVFGSVLSLIGLFVEHGRKIREGQT